MISRRPRNISAVGISFDTSLNGSNDPSAGVEAGRVQHARLRQQEQVPACAVTLGDGDVEPDRDRGQPVAVGVDDGEVVRSMQRLDDGRADIARADDEDLHPSGILTSARRRVRAAI